MRPIPHYEISDPDEVRRLIRSNPWATFVSPASTGLVASHYPILLDEDTDRLTIVSHFGRADSELHELGQHQVLLIVQGPHDYISSSWYPPGDVIPTWNHVTAHLYGTPEVLTDEETYIALAELTDHFERRQPEGRSLVEDEVGTRKIAKGAVGLRMRVDRLDTRAKLSQTKPAEVRETITEHLDEHNPRLATEMRRVPGSNARGATRRDGGSWGR